MKTVKEILEAYNDDYLAKQDPRFGKKFPPEKDIPAVIVLKRKAIRVYPDSQKIALYYSQQLDKYVSIPYGPGTQSSGIQVNEAKQPEFEPDVSDAEKAAYMSMYKGKVKRRDIRSKLPMHQLVKTFGARAAAGEAIRRYRPGGGAYLAGQLAGIPIAKAIHAVKSRLKRKPKQEQPAEKPQVQKNEPIYLGKEKVGPELAAKLAKKLPKTVNESFKENLRKKRKEKLDEGIGSSLDTAAEIAVPYYSAGKKLYKGDYAGAAKSAAVDTALLAVGGPLARAAVKGAKALVKGSKLAKGAAKGKKLGFKPTKTTKPKPTKGGLKGKLAAAGAGAALGSALSGGSGGDSQSAADYAKEKAKSATRFKEPEFGYLQPKISGGATSSQELYTQQQAFGGRQFTTARPRQESTNFDKIKMIAENNIKTDYVTFGDNSITINNRIAKKLINVYESLNKDNKKKVEEMINEDVNSFKKLINFAIRQ